MGARWSEEEKQVLREIWASPIPVKLQTHKLPTRNIDSIKQMGSKLGLNGKNRAFSPLLEKIRELMADRQPRTSLEVAMRVGGSISQVRDLMDGECAVNRFHIERWQQTGSNGRWQKVFKMGRGKNAEKPTPMTNMQRSRLFRARVDQDEYLFKRKKYALNRAIKTGRVIRRDPLVAALFGEAR